MSGLYLLGVVALWLWLTWLLLRFGWRKVLRKEKGITTEKLLVISVVLTWLGASFWYGGGRKYYYDWQVERMCAVDGGVKVYETVRLPANEFDKWGMVRFYKPNKGKNALGAAYEFHLDIDYIRREKPTLTRFHTRVIRKSDGKLLGESLVYTRAGGDLIGPWHPSGFVCPTNGSEVSLIKQIFLSKE